MRIGQLAAIMAVLLAVGACGHADASPRQPALSDGPTPPNGAASSAPPTATIAPGATNAPSPTSSASPTARRPAPPAPTPSGVVGTPFPTTAPAAPVILERGPTATHVHFGRIAFDIPAGWDFRPANVNEHYIDLVGFLGTAASTAACYPTANGVTCSTDFRLAPGDVSVLLMTQNGPAVVNPKSIANATDPGATVISIDGVPALHLAGPASDAVRRLDLTVLDPDIFGAML